MMTTRAPRTPSPHGRDVAENAPNAPLWGPRYDDQDVGGSRRSRRTTSNPFSSANTAKAKTPERRMANDELPSPPTSPSRARGIYTPKHARSKKTARFATDALGSRVDHTSLMLTPVKTPRHITPPSTGTSRNVVIQHGDPRDAMPTPRRMKNMARRGQGEIFASRRGTTTESFEIHTDWNARRPTLDLSEDNAFIGERTGSAKAQKRTRTTEPEPLAHHIDDDEMERRVNNDEGLIFSFRGKKVFRPYEDALPDLEEAEAMGYRPIRRSSGKPALLDFARLTRGSNGANDTDEEAVTDIEVGDDEAGVSSTRALPPTEEEVQQPAVNTRGGSLFHQWSRTKPGAAKGTRKREVEEEGPSTGAEKRAKNSL